MRIIITGGTGLIGRALSKALVERGDDVTVLSRNPIEAKSMPEGVHLHRWDAETAEGWGHLVDGADAIVNLAGANLGQQRWSTEYKKTIRDSRVNAGNAVMEAIRAAEVKPKVLIQGSAHGYYPSDTTDTEYAEDGRLGNDFLAKVLFDWEISTAPASRMGIRRPISRTGVVFSNDASAYKRLKLPFQFFVGGKLGDGEQWMPWVHIDDVVRGILFLIDNEAADGPFNLVAPEPVRAKELANAMGDVMGRPAAIPAPGFAIRTLFGEMSTVVLDGRKVVPAKLLEMGFDFNYPTIRMALAELNGKPVEKETNDPVPA
jgi:uncharacterized protein (TIGR01777 family)